MICAICETESWENVDQYRFKQFTDAAKTKPMGMCICTNCGFVSYPTLYKTEDEIKEYYRKDYRKIPNSGNLFTSERKLGFHEIFLSPIFEEFKKRGVEKPTMVDIGCALGLVPCWWKNVFPDGNIYGVELTKSFRRVAWHSLGVETQEDIKDEKHDLMMSYKVLEHQMDPHLKLKNYVEHLKDDGFFYISVPMWFENMSNFGAPGFDLEYYYDTNHINVWMVGHFEYLLAKSGLKVIRKDTMIYDTTYMCVRDESEKQKKITDFNIPTVAEIKDKMARIKKAAEYINVRDCEKAVEAYPQFPMAWIGLFELQRQTLHHQGWEAIEQFWKHALEVCGGNIELGLAWADVLMRYDKFEQAAQVVKNIRALRPRTHTLYFTEAQCYREIAKRERDENKRFQLYTKARELVDQVKMISTQAIAESLNWSYADSSEIPAPFEYNTEVVQ